MIKLEELDGIKQLMQSQLLLHGNDTIYAIVKGNIITWQIATRQFELDGFEQGDCLEENQVISAISHGQETKLNVYDDRNKKNLEIVTIPIEKQEGEEDSASLLTIKVKEHPLLKAFPYFAPIIERMFSEGAFLSLTSTKEILQVQRSEKYDIAVVEPGFDITQQTEILDVIKSGKRLRYDDDSLMYGPPVRVTVEPYFDPETKQAIGVLNIIRPKQAELSLKEMSESLEKQLAEVSITIQELAAASGLIHENEMDVNAQIQEINDMAHQIFEVSNLIKSIADSTKMLGLNASIEAARAGNAGKGFGVVADEINKLSEQSKNTVPKIKKLTDDIKAKVEESKLKSQHSLLSSEEQVASTEEITATIEAIQAVSLELSNLANQI